MNIKNIVIACDYAYIEGGASKVAILSAIALSKCAKYNIIYVAGCGEPCEELKGEKITIITLKEPDILHSNKIKAFFTGIYNNKIYEYVSDFLSHLNPEETIIHIHTWTKVLTSAIFKAANDCGISIFLTLHDYFLVCPNGGCFNYKTNKICEKTPMSFSCISANCDSRNYIYKFWRCLRQIKQNKIIESAKINYIFISEFQSVQISRRCKNLNRKFFIKNPIIINNRYRIKAEDNKIFLFIGRLSQEKGVILFCESVTRSNVKTLIIGDGQLKEMLSSKYKQIKFTGWINRDMIKKWISKARALIFPSLWYEGSPLTILEVQAYGIPCIVTQCSAAIDMIIHGVSGEIVTENIESIRSAIERFKDDNYVKHLSKNTYKMFDESRIVGAEYANQLLSIYDTANNIIG